jgi:hypothetical protein
VGHLLSTHICLLTLPKLRFRKLRASSLICKLASALSHALFFFFFSRKLTFYNFLPGLSGCLKPALLSHHRCSGCPAARTHPASLKVPNFPMYPPIPRVGGREQSGLSHRAGWRGGALGTDWPASPPGPPRPSGPGEGLAQRQRRRPAPSPGPRLANQELQWGPRDLEF